MKRTLASLLVATVVGVALAGTASCTAPSKGSLVLAISTDMQTPQDINVVSVFITTDSVVKFDYLGRVLPDGTVALPATLAVVEPDNPNAQVRIRVIAFNEVKPRVLRDVMTTVPHGQTSLLRLPLNILDDGSARSGMLDKNLVPGPGRAPDGTSSFIPDEIGSACDFGKLETMVNGDCVSATVESAKLPAYDETLVYGAGGINPVNGAPVDCFDTKACFTGATAAPAVDMGTCTVQLPAGSASGASSLNFALVTPDTGWCPTPGQCFVPLENDPQEGWTVQGSTVKMIRGICRRLSMGAQLYMATSACVSKALSNPICEQTTGVVAGNDAGAQDAGVSADGSIGTPCPSGMVMCGSVCVSGNMCGVSGDSGTSGCKASTQCPAQFPFCNTSTGICVGCRVNTDCPQGQVCNPGTLTCATGPTDAGTDGAPAPDSGTDAGGGDGGTSFDSGAGCTANINCGGGTPLCNIATGQCVMCVANTDCAGGTPYCQTNSGMCVQCLTGTNCPGGDICTSNNMCVDGGASDAASDGASDASGG